MATSQQLAAVKMGSTGGYLYSTRPPLQYSKIHIIGEISMLEKYSWKLYWGWSYAAAHDQRRCDTRHELLTQRALFCIGVNAKKGTLSQHFVTCDAPPLTHDHGQDF